LRLEVTLFLLQRMMHRVMVLTPVLQAVFMDSDKDTVAIRTCLFGLWLAGYAGKAAV
jgi:hypothetical protein